MRRSLYGVVVLSLLLGGCRGPAGPRSVPVTGAVTLDGKPLAGATVTFVPTTAAQGNRSPIGVTGDDGKYALKTGAQAGAPPGDYKVIISRRVMPNGSPVPPDDPTPPIESPAKESLPPAYSDLIRTTLKATVPDAGGTVDFPLKKSGA